MCIQTSSQKNGKKIKLPSFGSFEEELEIKDWEDENDSDYDDDGQFDEIDDDDDDFDPEDAIIGHKHNSDSVEEGVITDNSNVFKQRRLDQGSDAEYVSP